MNTIQKMIVEEYLLDRTFTSDVDYGFYISDLDDESLTEELENYKDEIPRLIERHKRALKELEKVKNNGRL